MFSTGYWYFISRAHKIPNEPFRFLGPQKIPDKSLIFFMGHK